MSLSPSRLLRGLQRRFTYWRLPRIARLEQVIDHLRPDTALVSCDCFDTLVRRHCDPPQRVLDHWAERVADHLAQSGLPRSQAAVLSERQRLEEQLRTAATDTDYEISIEDLHQALALSLGLPAQTLITIEETCERAALYPAPGAKELLDALRQRGIRIAVVSDMYWGEEHLCRWLTEMGLMDGDELILVSATRGRSKHRGGLYSVLLELSGLQSEQIIHVGDNPHADGVQAAAAGILPLWLHDRRDLKRRKQLRALSTSNGDRIAALDALLPPPKPPAGVDPDTFLIGRDIMGPAFFVFVCTTMRRIGRSSQGQKAVAAFLARDGWLPMRIAELLVKRDPHWAAFLNKVELRYLHLSRRSTVASSEGGPEDRLRRFASELSIHGTLAAVLRLMGCHDEDLSNLDLPYDLHAPLRSLGDLNAVVGELGQHAALLALLKCRSQEARQGLVGYLGEAGIYGHPLRSLHLIDLGWRATIQAHLTSLFAEDCNMPPMQGHLLGNLRTQRDLAADGRSSLQPGVIVDAHQPQVGDDQVPRATSLLELGCQTAEGSTIGYHLSHGKWQPLLGPAPAVDDRFREAIHCGVLARAEQLMEALRSSLIAEQTLVESARRRIIRFVTFPSHREAKTFRSVFFDVDMGTDARIPCITDKLAMADLFPPTRLLEAVRKVAWVEGSIAASRFWTGRLIHRFWLRLMRGKR